MNPFEQQMKLGRELMDLNTEWFRKLAEFDSKNFSSYIQFNQDFAGRLPEVKDIQGFIELQREYGKQLWNNTQEALKTRGDMQREAFKANNDIIRQAFTSESRNKAKAEAKPRAKQAATSTSTKAKAA